MWPPDPVIAAGLLCLTSLLHYNKKFSKLVSLYFTILKPQITVQPAYLKGKGIQLLYY